MNFAGILREAMGEMTQETLEGLTGIHQTTISRHLSGQSEPKLGALVRYQRALPKLRLLRPNVIAA